MKKGFTLIEILVVIAILASSGIILVAIFINTLRGSNKSQILSNIKQNGQAVLENMDKTLRGADNVACISSDRSTLVVVKNGEYQRFRFIPATSSANGYLTQDHPEQDIADIKVFLANVCNSALLSPVVLTDTSTTTGVSAEGFFSRSELTDYKPSINVRFTLGPGVNAPAVVAGQIDPVEFTTTIGLR